MHGLRAAARHLQARAGSRDFSPSLTAELGRGGHRSRAAARGLAAALLACSMAGALAADTMPARQLERFAAEAGRAGQPEAGRAFFTTTHGRAWSCASCHGERPTTPRRHAGTGKTIPPLAPAANPQALSDTARVDKWLRRNCRDVLQRECSAGEKADVIAWLIGPAR